jgi:hypothetical protein
MQTLTRTIVGVAASAALLTSLAACSDDKPSPVGEFKTLTGNTTSVKLDAGFAKALQSLKVTPGLIGTAKLNAKTGTLSFPITGGHVTVYKQGDVTPYVQGELDHDGSGFTLTAGGKKVGLEHFVIDPGNDSKLTGDVTLNGKSVANDAVLFDLDGSTLQTPTINSAGVATLTGTTVYLSTTAADLLNQTFGIDALTGGSKTGTKIGVATIKATGTS